MSTVIAVDNLGKTFAVQKSYPGFRGAIKTILSPKIEHVAAIDKLSLKVNAGERIAFIGPNGAGKSTTIKMLTGILHPTSGSIEVLGLIPWKERRKLGYQIGTVFGQRSQLWYHLPPDDTFSLLAKIYEIDSVSFKKKLSKLIEAFEIAPLLKIPVRQLSLGQRMRCELVASLLHGPKILFLDEPTIGLDINAKLTIRTLLNELSKDHGITLFLTSHDTADIEQVCDRVIVLDQGQIVVDNSLKDLKRTYLNSKIVTLITDEEKLSINLPGVEVIESSQHHFCCRIDLSITPIDQVIQTALKHANLKDITIEDPSMEEIIRLIYETSNV